MQPKCGRGTLYDCCCLPSCPCRLEILCVRIGLGNGAGVEIRVSERCVRQPESELEAGLDILLSLNV